MTRSQLIEAIQIAERLREIEKTNAIRKYFPDSGSLRRELYPKHTSFFELGATKRERLFMAGNRTGKSLAGAYEVACHLTGNYPAWWKGRKFKNAPRIWAAGDTSKTVRDIVQRVLLGDPGHYGTGMIPKDNILRVLARTGLGDAVDVVQVKHSSGGTAQLTFKSYDQRRESFQGTEQDVIWLDEECPLDIYTECGMRTMTNNGMILLTFTPLGGCTDVVKSFFESGNVDKPIQTGSKASVMASWRDVPHLTEQAKLDMLALIPPFQRDARSAGIPQLGAGAIYPVPESEITVNDFVPPPHWPRCYGLDVGWNATAVGFWAKDQDTGIAYMYHAFKVGHQRPSEIAARIRQVAGRIRGTIDPAARGRGQIDGEQLLQMYRDLGLDVFPANNAVEAGLFEVWQRLVAGRIKIMKGGCAQVLDEYRHYHRDENGKVVKEDDHLMDGALRYPVMTFMVDNNHWSASEAPLSREEAAMWGAAEQGKQRGHPMTTAQ